jgi:hypothetical protein
MYKDNEANPYLDSVKYPGINRNHESKDRQYNVKRKRTNNDLKITTQKTKD